MTHEEVRQWVDALNQHGDLPRAWDEIPEGFTARAFAMRVHVLRLMGKYRLALAHAVRAHDLALQSLLFDPWEEAVMRVGQAAALVVEIGIRLDLDGSELLPEIRRISRVRPEAAGLKFSADFSDAKLSLRRGDKDRALMLVNQLIDETATRHNSLGAYASFRAAVWSQFGDRERARRDVETSELHMAAGAPLPSAYHHAWLAVVNRVYLKDEARARECIRAIRSAPLPHETRRTALDRVRFWTERITYHAITV